MDEPNPPQSDKKILIVEDEEALANALRLKLSSAGYNVTMASNGQDGLNFALENKYDVMLMDLILPVVDGFTILATMHEKGIKTPVIVLSNLSQQEDVDKAKGLGAVEFLIKSDIQLSKVLEHIKKYL
jgi:DNA-binding response OmpR family regulator